MTARVRIALAIALVVFVTLPAIGISESGYIVIPHHNKYGHDYKDPPDDGGIYPAVRK